MILIEGIYEELEILDKKLKTARWKSGVLEKINLRHMYFNTFLIFLVNDILSIFFLFFPVVLTSLTSSKS